MKRKLGLMALAAMSLLSGCERMPTEVYEVKTVNGQIIRLKCPVLPEHRNGLTYYYDNQCVVIK